MARFLVNNDPIETDLKADLQMGLMLLKDLQDILVLAASRVDDGHHGQFIYAELVILGLRLKLLSPILHRLGEMDSTMLETYSRSLYTTLELLDELVIDKIWPENSQRPPLSSVYSASCPRLLLLRDIKLSRYKADQSSDGNDIYSCNNTYTSDEQLSIFLAFYDDTNKQKTLLESLSQLSHGINEILSLTVLNKSTKLGSHMVAEKEDENVRAARHAHNYREQISTLYTTLARSMSNCETEHMAELCISNFGLDKDSLDMYISICHRAVEATDSVIWHPARCLKKNGPASTLLENGLCRYLHKARARRLPAVLAYSGSSLAEDSVEAPRLKGSDVPQSFIDLAAVLDNTAHSPSWIMGPADKRRLQCLLAQSLLFLHPSLWLPEVLDLTNIHFASTSSAFDIKNPYMYSTFRLMDHDHSGSFSEEAIYTAVVDFMIHFGLLLLQIHQGKQLELLPEETEDEYGHELALDRCIQEFSQNIDEPLKQVLLCCLWFRTRCLERIAHKRLTLDLRIRLAISQYIFRPLVRSLEYLYPNVAHEILSYTYDQENTTQPSGNGKSKNAPQQVTINHKQQSHTAYSRHRYIKPNQQDLSISAVISYPNKVEIENAISAQDMVEEGNRESF